jgi:hypothetical protein
LVWIGLGVTLQGVIQPMALLTLSIILTGVTVGHWLTTRHVSASTGAVLIIVGLASAPWFINILWGMQINPQLANWNVQNFSPSPPAWEALVAGGLPLGLAGLGCFIAARRHTPRDQLLLMWLALQIMAIYAPVNLQRRLSLGLWMPLCLLASIGWHEGVAGRLKGYGRAGITALTVVGMILTNLFVYATLWGMIYTRDPGLFFTPEEKAGLAWLDTQADGEIVLASPTMGLFIPAWSDARVLYGHFLETVDAVNQERLVTDFFAGHIADPAQFLQTYGVRYVFYGPRERALGPPPALPAEWQIQFQQGDVTIYGP